MQRTATTISLIFGGVLLFVVGMAAGWQNGQGEPSVAGGSSDAPRSKESTVRAPTIGPRTASSLARADSALDSPRALDHLVLLTELNRRLRSKFSVTLAGFDGKLNENFVRLFAVTPAERQEFESMIAATGAELARLTASVARVEPRADGTFTISIPPFPAEGGRLYDQFVAKAGEIMGPERTDYMREMNILDEDQVFQFDRFGITQTTVDLNSAAERQSHWFMQFDEKTGTTTRTARLDLASFREKYPVIYENMRAAGLLPDGLVP